MIPREKVIGKLVCRQRSFAARAACDRPSSDIGRHRVCRSRWQLLVCLVICFNSTHSTQSFHSLTPLTPPLHSLTHSLHSLTHTHSLTSLTHSLHSLTHSLTSLTHSRTHSLPRSLTPSLTPLSLMSSRVNSPSVAVIHHSLLLTDATTITMTTMLLSFTLTARRSDGGIDSHARAAVGALEFAAHGVTRAQRRHCCVVRAGVAVACCVLRGPAVVACRKSCLLSTDLFVALYFLVAVILFCVSCARSRRATDGAPAHSPRPVVSRRAGVHLSPISDNKSFDCWFRHRKHIVAARSKNAFRNSRSSPQRQAG
jgi:hypothetical protein